MADFIPTEHAAPTIAAFSNSYARLPEHFHAHLEPTPVVKPYLIKFNQPLADELGLNAKAEDQAAIFAGNLIPAGAEALAMAYAGHQFGNFVQRLGDGRAILLGEVIDTNGIRRDILRKPVQRGQ